MEWVERHWRIMGTSSLLNKIIKGKKKGPVDIYDSVNVIVSSVLCSQIC